MDAAEVLVWPITTASRRRLLTTWRALTKPGPSCPKQSNFYATRFASDDWADEFRAASCYMDHRERGRLCSRARLPVRLACRFCPSLAQVSRKNLQVSARRGCDVFLRGRASFRPALFLLMRLTRWAASAGAPTIPARPIKTKR